jgi:ribonucleoside-diphosphate reductase alpha chain
MTTRERLPDRRESDLIEVEHVWRGAHGEVGETMLVTIGRHEDGRLGEVFIDYPPRDGERKKSERTIALGRDIAVLISVALQYGAPLDVLCHAVSREDAYVLGEIRVVPSTPVGTVLDALAVEARP